VKTKGERMPRGKPPKALSEYMTVRPELIGAEGLMLPFLANTSGQRASMVPSHLTQPVVLHNAEAPAIASGFEGVAGKFAFNRLTLEEDIKIVTTIPKFHNTMSTNGLSPTLIVVYVGLDSKKIGYLQLDHSMVGADGFGYINVWDNPHLRRQDTHIPKGTEVEFARAPNQEGDVWKYGINCNVTTMTAWGVVEDAFYISEEMAAKMAYTSVNHISINLSANDFPLNIYGDEGDYRFMPDVGHCVGEDGTLICTRDRSDPTTVLSNMDDANMRPQAQDEQYLVQPGATIVDVQVHLGQAFRKTTETEHVYAQLLMYDALHTEQYRRIVEAYFELTETESSISAGQGEYLLFKLEELKYGFLSVEIDASQGDIVDMVLCF